MSRFLSLGTLCYGHISGNICWSHDHLFVIPSFQQLQSSSPTSTSLNFHAPLTQHSYIYRTPRTSSSRASAIYKRPATQTVVAQTTQTRRVTLTLLRSRARVKASLQKTTIQAPSQGQYSFMGSISAFETLDEVYCDWGSTQVGFVITRAPGITAGTTSA